MSHIHRASFEAYKRKWGIYPIMGGSSNEPPPDPNAPGTVVVEEPPAEPPKSPVESEPAKSGFEAGVGEGKKTFTAEDVERIRKEEKDKLYGRIDEMSNELKAMREAEEARKRAIEEEEERKRQQAEKTAEEEMELRDLLAKKEQEWQSQFQSLQEEVQAKDAILEREREFQALEMYRQQRIQEESEHIMPELLDYIQGGNQEEIEQSIASLKDRTEQILTNVAQAQQQARMQMPGPRVTAPSGEAGDGPMAMVEGQTQTYSANDIRDMTMEEYRKKRPSLLGAASRKAREGGLYG